MHCLDIVDDYRAEARGIRSSCGSYTPSDGGNGKVTVIHGCIDIEQKSEFDGLTADIWSHS